MNENLKKNLLEGETVVWTGQTEAFRLTENPYGRKLFNSWSICAIIAMLGPFFYLSFARRSEMAPKGAFTALVVLVPLLFAIRPFFDRRKMQKELRYAITNLRAVCYTSDAFRAVFLDDIRDVSCTELSNGASSIVFGRLPKRHAEKDRNLAMFGSKDAQGNVTAMAFYSVSGAQEAVNLLGGVRTAAVKELRSA